MSKRILSLLAILALSACAPIDDSEASLDEDGDSDLVDEGDDGSLDSSQDAVTGTGCSNMTANAKEVLVAINDIRTKLGMAAINCNNAIQKAANAHSKYQSVNNDPGHDETPGKQWFTGVHFGARMEIAGYTRQGAGEVICAGCNGVEAVNAFMSNVYHRTPFVSFGVEDFGYGDFNSKFVTIDFGSGPYSNSNPWATKRAVWPTPGATGIPTTFDCTTESPNPCDAGLTNVGYPISLTGGSKLTVISAKLVKAGTTTPLPRMLLTLSNDSKIPYNQMYMIPKSPLKPATKYTATVVSSLNDISVTKTWSFTTK